MKFCKGDRVYYVSGRYEISRRNPLKQTIFECVGTVVSVTDRGYAGQQEVLVEWDNDRHNTYMDNDLEFAESQNLDNPNRAFRMKKGG